MRASLINVGLWVDEFVAVQDLINSVALEEQLDRNKIEHQTAEAEDVRLGREWLPSENIRVRIPRRPALYLDSPRISCLAGEAKISEAHLQLLFVQHEDVIRLDVSVEDVGPMHEVHREKKLLHYLSDLNFSQGLLLP